MIFPAAGESVFVDIESRPMQKSSSSLERQVQLDDDPTLEQSHPTCEMEPGLPAAWSGPGAGAAAPGSVAPLAVAVGVEPLSGRQVLRGRYRIEAMIGIGGFSVVYRARDLRCEKDDMAGARVAIKVLRPELMRSAAAVNRLKAEFRCTRLLSHPNVLRVYDLDRDGEVWFEVMELLDGKSLAATLRDRPGPSTLRRQDLAILRGCADALASAHAQGVVHGDVKPGNIILTASSGVRLIDFGATSAASLNEQSPAAGTGSLRATPAYASPQVLSGQAPEARDDVFSLACVAFELLTGSRPFGQRNATEAQLRGMQPADVEGLDERTARALAAGLAWNREDRPATVLRWMAMLEGATERVGAAISIVPAASRVVRQATSQRPAPRRPRVSTSIRFGWLVVAITATLVATVFALKPGRAPSSVTRAGPAPLQQRPPATAADLVAQDAAEAPALAPAISLAATPPSAGHAAKPGETGPSFSFAHELLTVSRSAPSASVPLRRDGPTATSAQVSWRIVEGTARAGRDFAGPASGSLGFASGQSQRTLVIPLLHGADANGGVTFSIEIGGVDGQVMTGKVPQVSVHIR
jgi:serine/threonine protein kinase